MTQTADVATDKQAPADRHTSALRADGLSKRYGRKTVVDDVGFDIKQGEIVGFLGPNGAGKTTTLRMIAGLIRPSSGSREVLGHPTPGPTLREVGTMIEEPSFYPYMTGYGNLEYVALLHGGVPAGRIDEVLRFVRMENAAHKKLSAYSQGMRQRLGLARALLWRPKILILDEPTNGLDPVGIAEFRESLRSVAAEGVTVFVSSHILAEIEKLVERVLVIEGGKLLFDGPLRDLTRQLDEKLVRYQLAATDAAALQRALQDLGLEPTSDEKNAMLRVDVPRGDADTLLSQLAERGVQVLEARRETESLESAYLRLLEQDGRPS